MTELIVNLKELPPSSPKRPGRVQELIGTIFQSDQKSVFGSWIIRPVEMLDRRLAALGRSPDSPSLAMQVGLHVLLDDRSEFLLRAETLRALPDPVTDWAAPNARRITKRALFLGMIGLLGVGVVSRLFAFPKNGPKEFRSVCQHR